MDKCEICEETKPCGQIVALRSTTAAWEETSRTVVCADCADVVGQIAAASVKSWIGHKNS